MREEDPYCQLTLMVDRPPDGSTPPGWDLEEQTKRPKEALLSSGLVLSSDHKGRTETSL